MYSLSLSMCLTYTHSRKHNSDTNRNDSKMTKKRLHLFSLFNTWSVHLQKWRENYEHFSASGYRFSGMHHFNILQMFDLSC